MRRPCCCGAKRLGSRGVAAGQRVGAVSPSLYRVGSRGFILRNSSRPSHRPAILNARKPGRGFRDVQRNTPNCGALPYLVDAPISRGCANSLRREKSRIETLTPVGARYLAIRDFLRAGSGLFLIGRVTRRRAQFESSDALGSSRAGQREGRGFRAIWLAPARRSTARLRALRRPLPCPTRCRQAPIEWANSSGRDCKRMPITELSRRVLRTACRARGRVSKRRYSA